MLRCVVHGVGGRFCAAGWPWPKWQLLAFVGICWQMLGGASLGALAWHPWHLLAGTRQKEKAESERQTVHNM